MRVVAFAPSLSAVEEDAGGVNIKGAIYTGDIDGV